MRFAMLKQLSYNDELTKDLFQDALIKIFIGLRDGKYSDSKGAISTWMYRVCSNTVKDYYRGLRKNPAIPNAHLFDEEMVEDAWFQGTLQKIIKDQYLESQDAEYKKLHETRFHLVEKYINKIQKETWRKSLYYRIILRCKCKEISKILKYPEITIRVYIHHAKKELKRIMIKDKIISE